MEDAVISLRDVDSGENSCLSPLGNLPDRASQACNYFGALVAHLQAHYGGLRGPSSLATVVQRSHAFEHDVRIHRPRRDGDGTELFELSGLLFFGRRSKEKNIKAARRSSARLARQEHAGPTTINCHEDVGKRQRKVAAFA